MPSLSAPIDPSVTLRIFGIPFPSLLSNVLQSVTPTNPTDYLVLGNHFFVIASVGYFIGHVLDSLFSDHDGINDMGINLLFFALSLVFVFDAVLYWKYSIKGIGWSKRHLSVDRPLRPPSSSNSDDTIPNRTDDTNDGSDVGEMRGNSFSSDSSNSDQSEVIVVGENIEMISNPNSNEDDLQLTAKAAAFHLHYQVNVFPLSAASLAEVLNVLGSLLSMTSALVPLVSRLVNGSSSIWDTHSLWFEFASMSSYLASAVCYYTTWYRVSGSTKYFQPTSIGFWAEFFNIAASLIYIGADAGYLGIAYKLVGEDQASRDIDFRKAEIAAFTGDIWYIASSVFYEWSFYRDWQRAAKFEERVTQMGKMEEETKEEGWGKRDKKRGRGRGVNDVGHSSNGFHGEYPTNHRNGNSRWHLRGKGDNSVIDGEDDIASALTVSAATDDDEGELFKSDMDPS